MQKKLGEIFKDKKILVTGGTGCIGSEIVRNLLKFDPKVVRIFSNDEDSTFKFKEELNGLKNVRFLIGDIRDKDRLKLAMEDISIVYHTAALKHVPLCEYNPFEAIKTNVLGTQNLIDVALEKGVEKLINISTDKAVNPVNTMGTTKLLAEKLIIDANNGKGRKKTIFSTVRFGNVLFSRGSVIPLFEEQIKNNKNVTITDENMTRFMMSLSDTINLVFKSTIIAKGGEIFILKMPVVKLGDLADIVIKRFADKYGYSPEEIDKTVIGPRSGEKMFEELMTELESEIAYETKDMIIVPPNIELPNIKYTINDYEDAEYCHLSRYSSRDIKPLSKGKIEKLLFNRQESIYLTQ